MWMRKPLRNATECASGYSDIYTVYGKKEKTYTHGFGGGGAQGLDYPFLREVMDAPSGSGSRMLSRQQCWARVLVGLSNQTSLPLQVMGVFFMVKVFRFRFEYSTLRKFANALIRSQTGSRNLLEVVTHL